MARVFSGWGNAVNLALVVLWVLGVGYFWVWWLDIEHVQSNGKYLLVTSILAWSTTMIPAYAIVIISRARIPSGDAAAWKNHRVAMVVTKAPSEPFAVLERTLRGALRQDGVPHDVWLADEDPTPQTIEWCHRHGVQISTRKGVTEYHQDGWPRRTKSKEGNLAYFYDHYGYDRYDFVAQFDVDHVPSRQYLREALVPFADPRVGYVSAPSICDSNAATRWSARGRLHEEASMHGLLQAGYNSGWAPLCIGSHYTVRTAALRAIGGLGPELAEDHSTTLLFNSAGWKGVHAVDAIAHGNGPDSFVDLVVQEFQWSRSLAMILIKYSPTYVPRLSGRLRFQFLFSQLWYPMFAGMMAAAVVLPIWALLTGEHFVSVLYADFLMHIMPLSIMLLVLAYWWRATGLFRPADAKIISWEGFAFRFLRWPWALCPGGVAMAARSRTAGLARRPPAAERSRAATPGGEKLT